MEKKKSLSSKQNRTNVRIDPKSLVRSGISLSSQIDPRLGANIGLKLFTTPILKKSFNHRFPSETIQKRIQVGHQNLFHYQIGRSHKKILFIHGWEGSASNFSKCFETLKDEGFELHAIDLPGHGLNARSGWDAYRCSQLIDDLNQQLGPFSFFVGHSFGAYSLSLALYQHDSIKDTPFISIASPNKLRNIIGGFTREIGLTSLQTDFFSAQLEKRFQVNIRELDQEIFLRDHQGELLLIHDQEDRMVPISEHIDVHGKIKNAQVLQTQGLGHTRILWDQQVLEQIRDFIRRTTIQTGKLDSYLRFGII